MGKPGRMQFLAAGRCNSPAQPQSSMHEEVAPSDDSEALGLPRMERSGPSSKDHAPPCLGDFFPEVDGDGKCCRLTVVVIMIQILWIRA